MIIQEDIKTVIQQNDRWDRIGEETAQILGFKPQDALPFTQLCRIIQSLGGFILPIPARERIHCQIPWIEIIGPNRFTLCDEGHNVESAAIALYYYIFASSMGKYQLKTEHDFCDDYYLANRFMSGMLIPESCIEKNPASEAHLINSTSVNAKYRHRIANIRCRCLGLID